LSVKDSEKEQLKEEVMNEERLLFFTQ